MSTVQPGAGEPIGSDDAEAVLAARAELGPTYDAELVDAFADRVEQVIQARVAEQVGGLNSVAKRQEAAGGRQFELGIWSLGLGIPITAVASAGELPGIIAAWAGIAVINVAHAMQRRR